MLRGTRVARRNRVGCGEGDDEEGNGNNIPGWLPVHHIIIIIKNDYNNNIMYIIYTYIKYIVTWVYIGVILFSRWFLDLIAYTNVRAQFVGRIHQDRRVR